MLHSWPLHDPHNLLGNSGVLVADYPASNVMADYYCPGNCKADRAEMTKKIALSNMRSHGCRNVLVYCRGNPYCHHDARVSADRWPDETSLSDLEPLFVCTRCGAIGARVWPDWSPHTAHRG